MEEEKPSLNPDQDEAKRSVDSAETKNEHRKSMIKSLKGKRISIFLNKLTLFSFNFTEKKPKFPFFYYREDHDSQILSEFYGK